MLQTYIYDAQIKILFYHLDLRHQRSPFFKVIKYRIATDHHQAEIEQAHSKSDEQVKNNTTQQKIVFYRFDKN